MADEPEVLSQEEIDALLASITHETNFTPVSQTTVEANNGIRVYDFRQPDRFSKEQMRALRLIHETWARRVSVSLSAHLRTAVEISLADIDQGVYASMIQQIPDVGVYYFISLLPLPGHLMLHVNQDLAMVILDRMMGGPGTVYQASRSLTDLEFNLLRSIAEKMMSDFQEAWANTAQIQMHIDDVSSSLLMVPLGLPTDSILWMSFEARIKGVASAMVLGLPYASLKPVANRLSPYNWVANAEAYQRDTSNLLQRRVEVTLSHTNTTVTVVLGSTVLSLQDLGMLVPGDVLPLNTRTDNLCDIRVNGRLKFRGHPGVRGHRMAIRIEEIIAEEWVGKEAEKN